MVADINMWCIWLTHLPEWCRRHVARYMVEVDVSTQQLFLSVRLIAVVTCVRFLAGVSEDVTLEVALVESRVRTQLTAETLLTVVCLQVNLRQQITSRVPPVVSYSNVYQHTASINVFNNNHNSNINNMQCNAKYFIPA